MNNLEKAYDYFDKGCNCSQSVFAGFAEEYGIKEKDAFLIASAFGGGIGRLGKICGALSGALMVVGLKYGYDSEKNPEIKDKLYQKARLVYEKFEKTNGSAICNELLGYDISNNDERKKAGDKGLFKTKCPVFVRIAAEIIESLVD